MASRYGRNQKRKARALLEAVKAQSELQERLHKAKLARLDMRFEKVADKYEMILQLISSTLGPHTLMRVLATGKMPVIHSGKSEPDNQPHRMVIPPSPIILSQPNAMAKVENVNVDELYELISHFRGSFERQLVAEVRYRSGYSCLALNEQAFKSCPDYTLISKISGELLNHLRRQL